MSLQVLSDSPIMHLSSFSRAFSLILTHERIYTGIIIMFLETLAVLKLLIITCAGG